MCLTPWKYEEVIAKVDTASAFTVYSAKRRTSIVEKGNRQGDKSKSSGNADRGEVI